MQRGLQLSSLVASPSPPGRSRAHMAKQHTARRFHIRAHDWPGGEGLVARLANYFPVCSYTCNCLDFSEFSNSTTSGGNQDLDEHTGKWIAILTYPSVSFW